MTITFAGRATQGRANVDRLAGLYSAFPPKYIVFVGFRENPTYMLIHQRQFAYRLHCLIRRTPALYLSGRFAPRDNNPNRAGIFLYQSKSGRCPLLQAPIPWHSRRYRFVTHISQRLVIKLS